jgi:hypothetical protein
MKQLIVILLVSSIFSSCISTNRIIEINNSKKGTNHFQLAQNPKAISREKSRNTLFNQFFNMRTTYLFIEQNDKKPVVTLEFHFAIPAPKDKLDSVMDLYLDDEAIRIVSKLKSHEISGNTQPASKNSLMVGQFTISENLWLSIANSSTIRYRLYLGLKRIEVQPDSMETIKVKEFFSKAMQRRLEIIPLVPSGKAKW